MINKKSFTYILMLSNVFNLSGVGTVYAILLIQLIAVRFHGIDEKGNYVFFFHWYCFKMLHQIVWQLSFVQSRPHRHLVVSLVPSQSVDLQIEEIHFRYVRVRLIAIVLGVFSSAFRPGTLYNHLVEIADVNVTSGII